MDKMLDAALEYARLGWPVVPCHPAGIRGACTCPHGADCKSPGKHPTTRNGLKSGTTDPEEIRAMWETWPDANIAVCTGHGAWVLDVDGEKGLADLAALEAERGALPATVAAKTGGGGMHLFFAMPNGAAIGNRAKIEGRALDVRGVAGYVIAPPSNHKSGNSYEWLRRPGDTPIADAPAWLLSFVTSESRPAPGAVIVAPEVRTPGALDLRAAEGVQEGGRHDAACRLIGAHLGRGENPIDVLTLALAWGKKCSPEMDEDELRRIVRDLSERDRRNAPPADAPPPDFPEEALYGPAGDIVRALLPVSEADPAALVGQFLVYFGNLVGRGPHFIVEATKHHANLFCVVVGESSKARKGTGGDRALSIVRPIDPTWASSRRSGGLSSGEGFVYLVRDAREEEKPIKEKGRIVGYQKETVDHGVTDKRLVVVETEFGALFRMMQRDGNTLSHMMRRAWDDGMLRVATKNSPLCATDAHVSFIGHITREELRMSMAQVEVFNGFANRFLWLFSRRSKLLPEGGSPVDLSPFTERLKGTVSALVNIGRMTRDADATKLWADLYATMATPEPGILGAITNRAEAQVLRLSMVYALLDGSAVITPDHLKAAWALWRYAADSARHLWGGALTSPLAERVLARLRAGEATKRDLFKTLGGRITADELDRVLRDLESRGLARCSRASTGGRPAETWSLT